MTTGASDETVIVGAGPAGMLLAYLLVTGGERVHLLERHPDFTREFRGEGIQASVVTLLKELGLLDELLASGAAVPAQAARIHVDDRMVAELRGHGAGEDFGIILHQERFLRFLHERLEERHGPATARPLYRATFCAPVTSVVVEGGRVRAVQVRTAGELATSAEQRVEGRAFIVAAGRGTGLRKQLGVEAESVDTHFHILWLRLPRPEDPALIPNGFRAYLTGDALFIVYSTVDGGLQLAWSRRDDDGLKDRSFDRRKARLLDDAPRSLRPYLDAAFTPETNTHFLKVRSDRAHRWTSRGVLFIGDAAHTMSPVAGQGINLAMRDAVVAANHLLHARAEGRDLDDELGDGFQAEREPEIRKMQRFQRVLGYFMLGAPRWQVRAFFQLVLPVLTFLGIRRRLLRDVQRGVTDVQYLPPPALHPLRSQPCPFPIAELTKRRLVTLILVVTAPLALAAAGAAEGGAGGDKPAPSANEPNAVQREMRLLEVAMQTSVSAIAAGDVRPLPRLLHGVHVASGDTEAALREGRYRLPKNGADHARFLELDRAFHQEMIRMVKAAKKNDVAQTAAHFGDLMQRCHACHAVYRHPPDVQ